MTIFCATCANPVGAVKIEVEGRVYCSVECYERTK